MVGREGGLLKLVDELELGLPVLARDGWTFILGVGVGVTSQGGGWTIPDTG